MPDHLVDAAEASAHGNPPQDAQPRRLRTAVAKGGLVLVVRQFLSVGLSVVGALLTTRIIGPVQYGTYITAFTIHQFIAGVFGLGVQAYLIRSPVAHGDRLFDIASTFLLGLGCVCGLAEAVAFHLAGGSLGIARAVPVLIFLAVTLPAQLASAPALARLDRQLNYDRVTLVDLLALGAYYGFGIVLAVMGWGAWALAVGWAVQQTISLLGYHWTARWRPRPAWDWAELRQLISYSVLWASSNWIWQARSLVNPFIVGNVLGIEAVGFVSLAQRLVDMLCFTRPIVWRVAMAAFARVQSEPKKLLSAIEDGMELQALAIGPPLIVFAVFGKDLVGILFGERWLPSFDVYPFVATASFVLVLFGMHSAALAVYGRNLAMVVFNAINLAVFAAATFLLLPKLGVRAVGVADIIALSSLAVLEWNFRERVGALSYRRALPMATSVTLALLLSVFTRWAGLLPLLALAWPGTWQRLVGHARTLIKAR